MARKKTQKQATVATAGTTLSVPPVSQLVVQEPSVLPQCAPQVTTDALVDYAVNHYEKACREQLDAQRKELEKAAGDLAKVEARLKAVVQASERELLLSFERRAEDAFEKLGFKLGKDCVRVTLVEASVTTAKATMSLQRGSYGDPWKRVEDVPMSAAYTDLRAEVDAFRKVEVKIRKKFLHWQNKLDQAERVRRDMRSKLTEATLRRLKGGAELLESLMDGFSEHYLQGPSEE